MIKLRWILFFPVAFIIWILSGIVFEVFCKILMGEYPVTILYCKPMIMLMGFYFTAKYVIPADDSVKIKVSLITSLILCCICVPFDLLFIIAIFNKYGVNHSLFYGMFWFLLGRISSIIYLSKSLFYDESL